MKPCHVLIVNDSLVITQVMQRILACDPQFTKIETAIDGIEAVNMVRKNQPDIILMDIHMPRQDGVKTEHKGHLLMILLRRYGLQVLADNPLD